MKANGLNVTEQEELGISVNFYKWACKTVFQPESKIKETHNISYVTSERD